MKKSFLLWTWLLLCTFFLPPLTARGETATFGIFTNSSSPNGAINVTTTNNTPEWKQRGDSNNYVYLIGKEQSVTVSAPGYTTLYVFSASENNTTSTTITYADQSFEAPGRGQTGSIDNLTQTQAIALTNNKCLAFTINDPSSEATITVGNEKNAYFWFMAVKEDAPTTPALTTVTPGVDATDVAKDASISFAYNVAVNTPTVTVTPEGKTALTGVNTTSNDNKAFTVTGVTLDYNTKYTVAVSATTTTDAGKTAVKGKTWSFTTAAFTAPTVTKVTPAEGATNVAVGSDIVIAYSGALAQNPVVTVGGTAATVEASADMKTFTVKGAGLVTAYNTLYEVSVAATPAAEDNSVSTAVKTWSFTTEKETVEATIGLTDKTTLWELPVGDGTQEHFDYTSMGTLAMIGVHQTDPEKDHVTLKKITETGHEGRMVFKIPAGNYSGTLVISADAVGKHIRVLTSTEVKTLADLQNSKNGATELGKLTAAGTVDIEYLTINADPSKVTYIYIYNADGAVNYHSVMWTLEPYFITAVAPTESKVEVPVGSDLTVTYNEAVNAPKITIDGTEATVTASTNNKTFTVAGAAAAENTKYSVVVGETTTTAGTKVLGKSWFFTTVAPAVKRYLTVCDVKVEVPESSTTTIDVALPYYTTFNYMDTEQVAANTVGENCTVTDVTAPKDNQKFEFDYTLKIDGEAYTMHLSRQAFRTTGELAVAGLNSDAVTTGALYLMPTQPVEVGSEPTAITIIADCTDEKDGMVHHAKDAFLEGVPNLTATFVWYDGKTETAIAAPTIAWDETNIAIHKQYGYKTSKIYGTFTHDGKTVRVAVIRNLVPPEDELRICTFEDIDLEQYLPSGNGADGTLNNITIKGMKIYASDADPKTPVRVTYFDVNDPSKSLSVGSYGPFKKSLKFGGKTTLDKNGVPEARYLSVRTTNDQVVMALALNGSTTHESMFRINCPQSESRARLLPSGGTGWWGHRIQDATTGYFDAKYYGYDSGTNGDKGANGGNVAYCFISAGPGAQYQSEDELGISFNPAMSTVMLGNDERALTTSNNQIMLTVKLPKLNETNVTGIPSFRTSHLSFRKICSINDLTNAPYNGLTPTMAAANQTLTFENSFGSEDKLAYTEMFAANLIYQSELTSIQEDGVDKWQVTLVVEPQKKLEANTYYELWGNHGMLLVADNATPGDRLLSYAMPLYRIFTAAEATFDYRNFEDQASKQDERIAASNVYVDSPTASAAVVKWNLQNEEVTGTEAQNGTSVLGIMDAELPNVSVGFDTPQDNVLMNYPNAFPGEQKVLGKTDSYTFITFDIYIPASAVRAVASVSLTAKDGTTIPLVKPGSAFVYDNNRKADVPVEKIDAQPIDKAGEWVTVMAASAVASSEFPAFPQTDRINVNIEGANKAYIDNLSFSQAAVPTAVAEIGKDKAAYFDGRQVVAPADCGVEVYNTTGALILTGKGSVDLSHLNSGIYIVRCGNDVLKIAK